jgi:hypothetical protein
MQQVLSLIKGFLGEMGGHLAPEAIIEEEHYYLPAGDPRPGSDRFFEIPARPSRPLSLQLFQVGRTRTYLIGQISSNGDIRPVHYASVASAILRREQGELSPHTRPLVADLLLLDLGGLEENDVIERYREGIEIIDTHPDEPGYMARRMAAMREAGRVRREMQEEGLLSCEEGRDARVVTVVDGSLARIEGAAESAGLVGLVPAEAEVLGAGGAVLACPFMARSALDTDIQPAAFYMRLRDSEGRNPDFGLLRVELGLKPDGNPADEGWASDISSLLLAERFPVDLQTEGWDKSIYALQHAEKYVDTLIPPPRVVTTYFGRSTA